MDQKKIEDFYDNFSAHQMKVGVNERIFSLYQRMKKYGLSSSSRILELGSGIGSMTYLLSKKVKSGLVESVDLSPKSIELLNSAISNPAIKGYAADVVNYTPKQSDFDFITLFDVIEHIPIERHAELFKNLASIMTEKTTLLINIPNPKYIEYDRIHQPEVLQVIDQPIPLTAIAKNMEDNGLFMHHFETYSIWVENDYQFMMIKKDREFKEVKLSERRSITEKVIHRLSLMWNTALS
ncbi:class I SAM-dependent methyltransferase [Owenweeksia hongkongensis]|uniref:class I SAM-dependent methyltransferase n=1 Tax=Owenweeksia hongkongensis TaxID=253245 RepID=UPI003A926E9D